MGVVGAVKVQAGVANTCALMANGTVKCWGQGMYGALGIGSLEDATSPVIVSGITDALDLSMHWAHACVRLTGGAIWCWGLNRVGQLGDGTTVNRSTPVQVRFN